MKDSTEFCRSKTTVNELQLFYDVCMQIFIQKPTSDEFRNFEILCLSIN